MELVEFGVLTDQLRAELVDDEVDPWDSAEMTPLQWRDKQHHVGLREQGGQLIASAGLLVVQVEAGGERFAVVGVGGVIVNRAHRGTGLSPRVIKAALARAATLGPELALLFCHENRSGLYRRFGFEPVRAEVRVDHEDGRIVMPMHTMWRALAPGAAWPEGPVVVRSRPF